jgi:hypothetical protein
MEIPVSFGNVSLGDEMARIGIAILRTKFSPAKADKNLCGRRLTGRIRLVKEGDNPDQPPLPGMAEDPIELVGIFDIKGYGVTRKKITTGLAFNKGSTKVEVLSKFARGDGVLIIEKIEELKAGESAATDEEAEQE